MATPAPDTYNVAAGVHSVHGGRVGTPLWREAMADSVWTEIGTNTINDINPANSAVHNPNGAGNPPPWATNVNDIEGIVGAWGDAYFDTDNERYGVWGGGHGDYQGNETYYIDLMADSPFWVMPRAPSGALTYEPAFDPQTGVESLATPADQPRSAHSYSKLIYIPEASAMQGAGMVLMNQPGNTSPAANDKDKQTYLLNIATGIWTNLNDVNGSLEDSLQASAGYIPSLDGVLNIGDDDNTHTLMSGDPLVHDDIDMPGSVPSVLASGTSHSIELAHLGVIVNAYPNGTTYTINLYDAADLEFDPQRYATQVEESPGYAPVIPTNFGGQGQMVYHAASGKLLVWDNEAGADIGKIWVLEPPASNPFSNNWTWRAPIAATGLTSAGRPNTGTFGRFACSDRFNCVYLLNATSEKLWACALPDDL